MEKTWRRWIPSSKMTAVLIAGVIYTYGLWILVVFYDLIIDPFTVAATQTWFVFSIGYVVTENRGTQWKPLEQ